MDESYLQSMKQRFNTVITIEEGVVTGGFGDGVSAWLLENSFQGNIRRLGLPDEFVQHGPRERILKDLGLDDKGIVNTINSLINIAKVTV
jgi:1-deoxy-D-xylulose-5-phosphate synthase